MITNYIVRYVTRMLERRPPRVICDGEGAPYLCRWYVFGQQSPADVGKTRLGWLPLVVYVHRFMRPDLDRDLHSHPWAEAVSFIFKGGYDEERRVGDAVEDRIYCAPTVNVIHRSTFHRIAELHGDTWSVFVGFGKRASWSFWDRDTGRVTPKEEFLRGH